MLTLHRKVPGRLVDLQILIWSVKLQKGLLFSFSCFGVNEHNNRCTRGATVVLQVEATGNLSLLNFSTSTTFLLRLVLLTFLLVLHLASMIPIQENGGDYRGQLLADLDRAKEGP